MDFHGWAEFVGVLKNVLVGAVKGQRVGQARAAHGRFETRVCRDGVVGEHAAVTPTADAEPLGIGDSAGHGKIYCSQQVRDFLVAPVGKDAAGKFRAAPVASPIIDGQHHIAVRGENLPLQFQRISVERQRVIVLSIWAAMNPQQRRIFFRGVIHWVA